MAKHNEVGKIGEDVACDFLGQKGFKVMERNFRKPYGEIDIIATDPKGLLRFVEVKTVSWETGGGEPRYRPEENVHPAKARRMMNVISAYLVSHETEGEWQFDVLAVFLDQNTKTAKVRFLENVVLGS